MKRVVKADTNMYSVMKKNKKGRWELQYSSWHEDSAWREADKLTGEVKVVYPDGEEKYLQ